VAREYNDCVVVVTNGGTVIDTLDAVAELILAGSPHTLI
jgi:hypothetical protein